MSRSRRPTPCSFASLGAGRGMSPQRLPSLKAREVIRTLEKAGFVVTRSKGSHHRLVHHADPSRATTVSVHKGKDIPRGTLSDIIEQAGLTEEEFLALL